MVVGNILTTCNAIPMLFVQCCVPGDDDDEQTIPSFPNY